MPNVVGGTSGEARDLDRGNSAGPRGESHLLLSTTYPLNASDTKRMRVGLRATGETGVFEPAIRLLGNTASGIRFDPDSWTAFKMSMGGMGSYLRAETRETPGPIILYSGIAIGFTTAYGARAIMVTQRSKTPQESTLAEMAAKAREDTDATPSSAKKRKIYSPSIVMQRISFEGLENIVRCIDAKYEELQSLASCVNDCARFLIAEIELNLPGKKAVDEDMVKSTLTGKYVEIRENVRRQMKDLQFLDYTFNIVFSELTSLYHHDISQRIIRNVSA